MEPDTLKDLVFAPWPNDRVNHLLDFAASYITPPQMRGLGTELGLAPAAQVISGLVFLTGDLGGQGEGPYLHGLAIRLDPRDQYLSSAIATEMIVSMDLKTAAPTLSNISLWNHNGSLMSLDLIGNQLRFTYAKPRPGMIDAGARLGSQLVEGRLQGDRISGVALIFAWQCGQFPYQVDGEVSKNGTHITLKGSAPRIERATCAVKGSTPDVLNFDLKSGSSIATLLASADHHTTELGARSSAAYQQGQTDRQSWESWFATVTGEYRSGAEYWAAHRSTPNPRSCNAVPPSTGNDWTAGCFAAQQRLAAPDVRRKTEPEYRSGWENPDMGVPTAAFPAADTIFTAAIGPKCKDESGPVSLWICPGPAGYAVRFWDEGNFVALTIAPARSIDKAEPTVQWRAAGKAFGDKVQWIMRGGVPKAAVIRTFRRKNEDDESEIEEFSVFTIDGARACAYGAVEVHLPRASEVALAQAQQAAERHCS
jgi:hypothetical protein